MLGAGLQVFFFVSHGTQSVIDIRIRNSKRLRISRPLQPSSICCRPTVASSFRVVLYHHKWPSGRPESKSRKFMSVVVITQN